MTEAEWLECTDPSRLLSNVQGMATCRKFRLFLCAWYRLHWNSLTPQGRSAPETGELFADGQASDADRASAWEAARAVENKEHDFLTHTARYTVQGDMHMWHLAWGAASTKKMIPKQVAIIRCIFGNPFHPVTINPAWLGWNDGTVKKIAQAVYDERTFDRLPILADALEEAGCTNADILTHCRQPSEHVRGCWLLDALLGKS